MISDRRIDAAMDHARRLGEVGVQVAAYRDGELIVDAWTGCADQVRTGRLVDGTTLLTAFSASKAVVAAALALQVDRGLVRYEAPVSAYWPDFAVNGKQTITVREAVSHRAGIPQLPSGVTVEQMCDWDYMTSAIANTTPVFAPGTCNAYHPLSWGWLIGEIIRRSDPSGRPFDRFVREELLVPLGIDELHFGVPSEKLWRVADVLVPGPAAMQDSEVYERAMPIQVAPGTVYNRTDIRQSVNPGAGGVMNARSLARLFAMLANGGELDGLRLLSTETVESLTVAREEPDSVDRTLGVPVLVGGGGYWLGGDVPHAYPIVGTGPRVLCSPGAGGAIGWADLDEGLSVAIQHNMMHQDRMFAADPETNPFLRLADAVREVAAEHSGKPARR